MRPAISIGGLVSAWNVLGCDLALLYPLGRTFGLTAAPVALGPAEEPAVPPAAASAAGPAADPREQDQHHSTEPTAQKPVTEPARFRDTARLTARRLPDEDER